MYLFKRLKTIERVLEAVIELLDKKDIIRNDEIQIEILEQGAKHYGGDDE